MDCWFLKFYLMINKRGRKKLKPKIYNKIPVLTPYKKGRLFDFQENCHLVTAPAYLLNLYPLYRNNITVPLRKISPFGSFPLT